MKNDRLNRQPVINGGDEEKSSSIDSIWGIVKEKAEEIETGFKEYVLNLQKFRSYMEVDGTTNVRAYRRLKSLTLASGLNFREKWRELPLLDIDLPDSHEEINLDFSLWGHHSTKQIAGPDGTDSSSDLQHIKTEILKLSHQISKDKDFLSTVEALEAQVDEYKHGYAVNTHRNSLNSLINSLDLIEAILKAENSGEVQMSLEARQAIESLLILQRQSIALFGLEEFQPLVGDVYLDSRGSEKVLDVDPPSPEYYGKISKIISPGYRSTLPESEIMARLVIRTSKVAVYKMVMGG